MARLPPCHRCHGLVIDEYGEQRCCNCGDRPFAPFVPFEIKNVGRIQAKYFLKCEQCTGEALDGYVLCWDCRKQLRKTQGRRIAKMKIL